MLSIALRPVRKGVREGRLEATVRKEVRADTDRDRQSGTKTRRWTENEEALPTGHFFQRAVLLFALGADERKPRCARLGCRGSTLSTVLPRERALLLTPGLLILPFGINQ